MDNERDVYSETETLREDSDPNENLGKAIISSEQNTVELHGPPTSPGPPATVLNLHLVTLGTK